MTTDFRLQQRAFDASTTFRGAGVGWQAAALASQGQRERWMLLLLDGRRSIIWVARLTQRNELDVTSTLTRFEQRVTWTRAAGLLYYLWLP